MTENKQTREERLDDLSQEAVQIIEILDQIEIHTANLRKKLMEELKLKSESNSLNLKLDKISE